MWLNHRKVTDAQGKSSVECPRFPRRERQPQPPTYLLAKFGRKLHENNNAFQ